MKTEEVLGQNMRMPEFTSDVNPVKLQDSKPNYMVLCKQIRFPDENDNNNIRV